MPGLSVIASRSGITPPMAAKCSAIRDRMLHFPSYTARTLYSDAHADIGFTGYRSYPKQVIDTPGRILILEGMVYNRDPASLTASLTAIADAFLPSENIPSDLLKEFLLNADGEFILTIYDKVNQRLLLANDMLGRLPLYYITNHSRFLFSRELKFIVPFLDELSFNKTGIMEYLLYGYPFEENTFINGVGFFPAGSVLCYNIKSGETVRKSYYSLNLEARAEKRRRPEIVSRMRNLFMNAVTSRLQHTGDGNVIVSLSGGLDSRATLAGLRQLGCRPTAVTATGSEEGLARKVAGAMEVETYAMVQGQSDSRRDFENIVFLKDGLDCHPNLPQLYDNLENLKNRFGEETLYYTGIYGGEITRHSHPTGGLNSVSDLARYLLDARDSGKCATDSVAGLLELSQQEIAVRLSRRLLAFPEKSAYKKYLRFRHECDMRFAGEAEDRNRFYFWTLSPYLSPPFFHYVMGIDENRKNTRLFRDFLLAIDPRTCAVRYYNYQLPLKSTVLLMAFSVIERGARQRWFKNGLRRLIRLVKACKQLLPKTKLMEDAEIRVLRSQLIDLLSKPTAAGRFFNHPRLAEFINRETDGQSLDRLRIVWVYLNQTESWSRSFH